MFRDKEDNIYADRDFESLEFLEIVSELIDI
jgi:hypothetical protein